jgi:cbb3-type cytochrome oxidase maturation protein
MTAVLFAGISEIEPYIAITVAAGGAVATWLCFLLWGWRSGQFDDVEAAKYRVLDDDTPGVERGAPSAAARVIGAREEP